MLYETKATWGTDVSPNAMSWNATFNSTYAIGGVIGVIPIVAIVILIIVGCTIFAAGRAY